MERRGVSQQHNVDRMPTAVVGKTDQLGGTDQSIHRRRRGWRTALTVGVGAPIALALAACGALGSTGGSAATPASSEPTVTAGTLVANPGFYDGTDLTINVSAGQLRASSNLGPIEAPIPDLSKVGRGDTKGTLVAFVTDKTGDNTIGIFASEGTPKSEVDKIEKAAKNGTPLAITGTPEGTQSGTEFQKELIRDDDQTGTVVVLNAA